MGNPATFSRIWTAKRYRQGVTDVLITGVGSGERGPMLEIRTATGGKDLRDPAAVRGWVVAGERQCIGYRAPDSEHLEPCPEGHITGRAAQCDLCLERAALLPCLRCTGLRCSNPERREGCVQPDNHAVYVAAFAPGIIKVGVARWHRRHMRIREQGARAALIVARDDGQQVRRLEATLHRFGAVDRLSVSERLTAWTRPARPEDLHAELETFARRMRARLLDAQWLDDPEPVPLDATGLLAYRPRLIRPTAGAVIRGDFERYIGHTMVMSRDGELIAHDLPSLIGYPIAPAGSDHSSAHQMALGV